MAEAIFNIGVSTRGGDPVNWDLSLDPHLGVYGNRASGKTNLACHMVRQGGDLQWDVRIIDILGGGLAYMWDRIGWKAGSADEAVFILSDVKRMLDAEGKPKKPVLLVIEEAQNLVSGAKQEKFDLASVQAAAEIVDRVLKEGAEKDIHVVLCSTKRPTKWRTTLSVACGSMNAPEAAANLGFDRDLPAQSLPPEMNGAYVRKGNEKSITAVSIPKFAPPPRS